jgi:hypothetical protein
VDNNSPTPGGTEFDQLLGVMSAIAEAVNKFNDPETGRAAFDSLMSARGMERKPKPTAPADLRVVEPPVGDAGADGAAADTQQSQATPRARRARKSGGKKSWPRPDLNFRPADKQSLVEFVAELQATNFHEKNTALVFYLQHVLGSTGDITPGHVAEAYDASAWTPPRDVENSLAKTSSDKRWLNTSDMKAIRTTNNGEHEVKYKMLAKKATPA